MSIACVLLDEPVPASDGALDAFARACSPRVEPHGETAVLIDVRGLTRVCGPLPVIAQEMARVAAERGLRVRVSIASTRTSAWLLAHAHAGLTVVDPGHDRVTLARLPIGWLGTLIGLDRAGVAAGTPPAPLLRRGARHAGRHIRLAPPGPLVAGGHRVSPSTSGVPTSATPGVSTTDVSPQERRLTEMYRERLAIFERWGIRTLGDLAALPREDMHARMGSMGVRWHQAACGEDPVPLQPEDEPQRFVDRMDLEWPIEGLEPLAFVLSRQCERLEVALERADRGIIGVTTRLSLVTREQHERTLQLPAPLRDARVLRTLILLDLESHPPSAAIDAIDVALEVAPATILQRSLLAGISPSAEDLTTLLARLGALMGERRVGAPCVVDSYDPRPIAMQPFWLPQARSSHLSFSDAGAPPPALTRSGAAPQHAPRGAAFRRYRLPVAARVTVDRGMPVRVVASGRGIAAGAVVTAAGPWRTSGAWWGGDRAAWDRDEWDVALASGGVYRLARDRASGLWEIEGCFD